jgi:uncharacterized membrane protein YadS
MGKTTKLMIGMFITIEIFLHIICWSLKSVKSFTLSVQRLEKKLGVVMIGFSLSLSHLSKYEINVMGTQRLLFTMLELAIPRLVYSDRQVYRIPRE